MTAACATRGERRAPPVHPALGSHPALGELDDAWSYMARHSRSFRLASRMLDDAQRPHVVRMYAWCRFTDDLADRPQLDGDAAEAVEAWLDCSQEAYEGRPSGIDLVDRVMGEMARREIPFAYAADLVAGIRSDLRFTPFRTLAGLRVYTYRVAGVVGRWLAELHGVRDAWMLERAAALGHAMQLTNILRDVGEDWDQGRVYLPLATLAAHGLTAEDIGAMRRGERPVDPPYRAVIDELMTVASRDYAAAREAIPLLPCRFRRAAAVAAAVYEGIHDMIRQNGYDNLHRRAATTPARKVVLATGALWTASRSPALRRAVSLAPPAAVGPTPVRDPG
ncbi:MAG TPA: phytoene/squalene synthase family protein [Gemmatimonadales bacterium]